MVAIGLSLFFSAKNEAFYSGDNFKNITETMAPIALVAAGMAMLLICGEIDLAVGQGVRAGARDRLCGLVRGAARPPDLGRRDRRPRLLVPRRLDERRDHDVPARAVVHHDARDALPPERHHPALAGGDAGLHAGRRDLQEDLRLPARRVRRLLQLHVLVGAGNLPRAAVRADLDAVGDAHDRHGRKHRRRRRGGRERPHDQDRQLRARQLPRRLRGDPRLHPDHDDRAARRAAPTSCSSP